MSLFLTLDQYNNLYSHEWLFYLPLIIFIFLFLNLRPWPEGCYELGSVRPFVLSSFCPSIFSPFRPSLQKLFGIGLLDFFWGLAWC